jgi:hypothetical protein
MWLRGAQAVVHVEEREAIGRDFYCKRANDDCMLEVRESLPYRRERDAVPRCSAFYCKRRLHPRFQFVSADSLNVANCWC